MCVINNSLPWYIPASIPFIESNLNKNQTVLDIGSGNSTLWYAARTKFVHAIETEVNWYEIIKNNQPDNVQLDFKTKEDIITTLSNVTSSYNVVSIDPMESEASIGNTTTSRKTMLDLVMANFSNVDMYVLDNWGEKYWYHDIYDLDEIGLKNRYPILSDYTVQDFFVPAGWMGLGTRVIFKA